MRKNIVSQLRFDSGVALHAVGTIYADGTSAIQLVDAATRMPVAKASVNMGVPIQSHMCFIKDYSENEGMAKTLVDAGIIELIANMNMEAGYESVNAYEIVDHHVLVDIQEAKERVV